MNAGGRLSANTRCVLTHEFHPQRPVQPSLSGLLVSFLHYAGGRSAQIDARANRWDAQEYESLKAERDRLKRVVDVSAAYHTCCLSAAHCAMAFVTSQSNG